MWRSRPHDGRVWTAATQDHGIFLSRDGGRTWGRLEAVPGAGMTWNHVAFSPHKEGVLAAAALSRGCGCRRIWGKAGRAGARAGLPSRQVWRVRFDPDAAGRLYASVHEEAVYVSEDRGGRGGSR